MKKIDIFNHIQPERYFEEISKLDGAKGGIGQRTASVSRLRDLDGRFREMDEFGDYRQVVTIPGPQPGNLAGPEKAAEIARIGNDSMAELVDRYPTVSPVSPPAWRLTTRMGRWKKRGAP